MDADGDGKLDKGELKAMLAKEFKRVEISDKEIDAIFERFDTDKEGTLDMEEYEIFKREYEKEVIQKTPAIEAGSGKPAIEAGGDKKAAAIEAAPEVPLLEAGEEKKDGGTVSA